MLGLHQRQCGRARRDRGRRARDLGAGRRSRSSTAAPTATWTPRRQQRCSSPRASSFPDVTTASGFRTATSEVSPRGGGSGTQDRRLAGGTVKPVDSREQDDQNVFLGRLPWPSLVALAASVAPAVGAPLAGATEGVGDRAGDGKHRPRFGAGATGQRAGQAGGRSSEKIAEPVEQIAQREQTAEPVAQATEPVQEATQPLERTADP